MCHFAEIQTAHHGSGSNDKHEPQRRCPQVAEPPLCPCHLLLAHHRQQGDHPGAQGGKPQNRTEDLHGLTFHASILAPKKPESHGTR